MLFKNSSEVQKFLPQTAEFEFDALRPFIERDGEPNLIKAHLGDALYANLRDAYQDNTMNDAWQELLDKVRYPLANYAYLKYLPFAQVTIGKSGFGRTETDGFKSAYEYQVVQVENACHEAAFNGIEQLLIFLEENLETDEYVDWQSSTGFTRFRELFITTAQDFSDYYNIGSSRRTFLAMRAILKEVEEIRVKAVLGKEFYAELKTQIADPDPTALTAENALLLPYIKRAVANLSIADACVKLPVKMTADGPQLISTSDRMTMKVLTQAETERLSAIIKQATEAGDTALKQLEEFIYANIDDYDTFQASDTYQDPDDTEPFDQSGNGIVIL